MKLSIFIGLIASLLTLPGFQCSKTGGEGCHPAGPPCYKGRLEVAGICRNYTISVLSSIDPGKVEATWTDPTTNKTYNNVFRLGSYCSFPSDIKAGDEFYFTLADKEDSEC